MGNFITASSPILSMITTEGDIGNKTKAAKEHFETNCDLVKTAIPVGAVSVGALSLAGKDLKADKFIARKLKEYNINNKKGVKELLIKVGKKIKSLPLKTKALLSVAALGLATIRYLQMQTIFNNGKIDQKYEDRAKILNKYDKAIN